MSRQFGIYIHIPFCAAVCHYCDFIKSAQYHGQFQQAYLRRLTSVLTAAKKRHPLSDPENRVTSIFFGGGTPSLLGDFYAPLMHTLTSLQSEGCEITLEANPMDCTKEAVKKWKSLGFNRLSLGIQTLDNHGLAFLTRDHRERDIRIALTNALEYFENVNIDLIYGWQGQSLKSWIKDLNWVTQSNITHVSAYHLTFEPRTVIGRRYFRGIIPKVRDEALEEFYRHAKEQFEAFGFQHDEISNWSRPNWSCQHNWIYWQDKTFISFGPGSHGYLSEADTIGTRYFFSPHIPRFGKHIPLEDTEGDFLSFLKQLGAKIESSRSVDDWLAEYIGSGLRTKKGICLSRVATLSDRHFNPTGLMKRALDEGLLSQKGSRLLLHDNEWFRETAWSLEALRSLQR